MDFPEEMKKLDISIQTVGNLLPFQLATKMPKTACRPPRVALAEPKWLGAPSQELVLESS